MRVSSANTQSYIDGKDVLPITVIFGADSSKTRRLTQKLANSILGENAHEEMRKASFDFKDVHKEAEPLYAHLQSVGFFPGKKGALIFDASENALALLEEMAEDIRGGEEYIFVQAGNLRKTGKIRKALENHAKIGFIGIYDEPLNQAEMQTLLRTHQLRLTREAEQSLFIFAQTYDSGAFERLVETLALYQGEAEALAEDALCALLPGSQASAVDEMIAQLLRGEADRLIANLRRAEAQGVSLHQIIGAALRQCHILLSLKASSDPRQAINHLRPPVFGARRTVLESALSRFSEQNLNQAVITLRDAEKTLRSGKKYIPEIAACERALLRVAMLARAKNRA